MSRKLTKGFDDGFGVKSPQNNMLNNLTGDLRQDHIDNNSANELVNELRRKYPKDVAIIKLSKALGLEPKQKRNKKNIACGNHRATAAFAKSNRPISENARSATGSGGRKTAVNIEKYAPNDFYRAVGRIAVCFLNMK